MTPKEVLKALRSSGKRQPEIVQELKLKGVETTQATISRIESGEIKNPNYDLGKAITSLMESDTAA
ncbi:MAG: hypothetical protein ACRBCS_02995 [Cellvibrionaceae bacterium]